MQHLTKVLFLVLIINAFVESRFPIGFSTSLGILKRKADQILDAAGGNTQCSKDLKILIHDFIFMKKWALEMVDASGKVNSGLLQGNNFIVGSFDGCLDISVKRVNHTINGKYCTVVLAPSSSFTSEFSFMFDSVAFSNFLGIKLNTHHKDMLKMLKLTYGLCIPESCSINNLQKLWDYIEHNSRSPAHLAFNEMMCRSKHKPIEPNGIDIYVYIFFGIYATILLLSTLYDLLIHQQIEPNENNVWISFSVYTNFKKLFSHGPKSEYGHLYCINGMKVWSMLWIIYAHRVLYGGFAGITNTKYIYQWKQEWSTTLLLSAALAVDTFFVLGGLLLSYGFLRYRSLNPNQKISFLGIQLYRLFRLFPALVAVMMFRVSVFKHMGDGPIWPLLVTMTAGVCRHTWWVTVLFLTNFLDHNYQCMNHTWYLAVDTQLFLISPIILIGLMKRPWRTSLICLAVCLLSGIYAFIITINKNLGCIHFEANAPYRQYIYLPTFVRAPPWLIGTVFGFVLYRYQQVRIPKVASIFAWLSSLSAMAGLVLVHIVFATKDYDPLKAAIYNASTRQIWSFAIGTIVFLCSTGHGGFINKFLSMPINQVLVKLSYSIYLVHLEVIFHSIGTRRHAEYFSNTKLVREFMGDVFFTLIAATICCLAFESPFLVISKCWFKRDLEQKQIDKVPKKKRNRKVFNDFKASHKFENKKYA